MVMIEGERGESQSEGPTLHFLSGKAGSGKSTIAARIAHENSAVLISEDIWLFRLYGDQMKTFEDYLRFSKNLKEVVGPLATNLLRLENSVVLDFPANTAASRTWYRSIFENANAAHVLHHVATTDEVCLQRIEKRNAERPEGSHHLTKEDFVYISSFFEAPGDAEGFNVRLYPS